MLVTCSSIVTTRRDGVPHLSQACLRYIPLHGKMAAPVSRRGAFQLLTSSSRISQRSFSSSRISAAFASPPRAQSTTTTAAKPASSTTSTYKAPAPAAPRTVTPSFPAKEPPVPTSRSTAAAAATSGQRSLTEGLSDAPAEIEGVAAHDWTRSYHGLGSVSFSPEQAETLLAPVTSEDVEVKPDGILYLPEIKYRRILNKAFGPGGWGLAPRGESIVTAKLVTREYGMVVQGRYVYPHLRNPWR
jgi:hypothetical protein